MRVLFNERDLRPILIREANQHLSLAIVPDDVKCTFETNGEYDVIGVALEFEASYPRHPYPQPLQRMTDLENLQKQEHLYAVAEEERFDQNCKQIWDLFIQLSPAHQHDLLEKLRDDFAVDLSEDDDQ